MNKKKKDLNTKVVLVNLRQGIDKIVPLNDPGTKYVYEIQIESKKYVIKGFKLDFSKANIDNFLKQIKALSYIFQEYNFCIYMNDNSIHFPKPYGFDIAENPPGSGNFFIEQLYDFAGESLKDLKPIKKIKQAYICMKQTVEAIYQMHKHGVLHLDLKPGKILFDKKNKKIAIIDMGSSHQTAGKSAYDETEGLSKVQELTLAYSPPEVIQENYGIRDGQALVPGKVDVYCIGMTFYDLLVCPTNEDLSNDVNSFKLKKSEKYNEYLKRIAAQLEDLDASETKDIEYKKTIKEAIMKCLSYEPSQRPEMIELYKAFKCDEGGKEKEIVKVVETREEDKQATKKIEELKLKEKELKELEELLKAKEKEIKEREDSLKRKEKNATDREDNIRLNERNMSEREDAIKAKDKQLREREETLTGREKILNEREKDIAKKAEKAKQNDSNVSKDELKERDNVIKQKEQLITELTAELRKIKDKSSQDESKANSLTNQLQQKENSIKELELKLKKAIDQPKPKAPEEKKEPAPSSAGNRKLEVKAASRLIEQLYYRKMLGESEETIKKMKTEDEAKSKKLLDIDKSFANKAAEEAASRNLEIKNKSLSEESENKKKELQSIEEAIQKNKGLIKQQEETIEKNKSIVKQQEVKGEKKTIPEAEVKKTEEETEPKILSIDNKTTEAMRNDFIKAIKDLDKVNRDDTPLDESLQNIVKLFDEKYNKYWNIVAMPESHHILQKPALKKSIECYYNKMVYLLFRIESNAEKYNKDKIKVLSDKCNLATKFDLGVLVAEASKKYQDNLKARASHIQDQMGDKYKCLWNVLICKHSCFTPSATQMTAVIKYHGLEFIISKVYAFTEEGREELEYVQKDEGVPEEVKELFKKSLVNSCKGSANNHEKCEIIKKDLEGSFKGEWAVGIFKDGSYSFKYYNKNYIHMKYLGLQFVGWQSKIIE